jgi:hypothetical protein
MKKFPTGVVLVSASPIRVMDGITSIARVRR